MEKQTNSQRIPIINKILEQNKSGCFEQVYIENHKTTTYPYSANDQNFPHHPDSISSGMCMDPKIKWVPAESMIMGTENSLDSKNSDKSLNYNYSLQIDNLEEPCFCNRSLTYALLAMNWFFPKAFEDIFIDRKVRPRYLYEFKVYVNGQLIRIAIDSYVPVRDGKHIFAEHVKNSIFPCLFQKLIAKIYGCYENISGSMIDIIQLFTFYHKEVIPFYIYRMDPQKLVDIFLKVIDKGSTNFFRTRNSVRLETVGLASDCEYIITRVIKIQGKWIIEFLEIDGTAWIGKYSKMRAFWQLQHPQIKSQELNISGYGRQNYISIEDLIGVSRQFITLHNNQNYHKKSYLITSLKEKHIFTLKPQSSTCRTLIQVNFKGKQTRSLMMVISYEKNIPKIQNTSFKKLKTQNFIELIQQPGHHYQLIIYAEDIESKPIPYNIYVASQNPEVELEHKQTTNSYEEEEMVFLKVLQQINAPVTFLESGYKKNSQIRIKSMYTKMGLGFIYIYLSENFKNRLKLQIDHEKLTAEGISLVNLKGNQIELKPVCEKIIIMKLKGKFNEGGCFPPKNGIKFLVEESSNHFYSVFSEYI